MAEPRRDRNAADLPQVLAIFPLPGALLLPGAQLPLNIFEPRYLNMIDDALRSERVIGMVQTSAPVTEHLVPDGSAVFDIGCAGRIVRFAETDDGRYIITLSGQRRFRILSEIAPLHGYRRIVPDYSAFADDLRDAAEGKIADREALLREMGAYFDARGIGADRDAIAGAPDPVLVNTLAMSCPFEPREKQALLECKTTTERGGLLTELFRFGAMGGAEHAPETRQ